MREDPTVEIRDTARLIVLDPEDRLLLMRLGPPAGGGTELWVTLGGRIEAGETVLQAAQRELAEETGITDAEVGPVVWYGEQVLDVAGRHRHLRESFVLVRCPGAAINDAGWTDDEREVIVEMHTAYLVVTLAFALMVFYSGVGKIRRDPLPVRVIHETVGVPLKYFPLLAACEFAGALGLVVGIWLPPIGIAAKLEAARKVGDPPLYKLLPGAADFGKCPTQIIGNRAELMRAVRAGK